MGSIIRRYYDLMMMVTWLVEAQNLSTDQLGQARIAGRNFNLPVGYKSEPVICIKEGFQADPTNCERFYRCMKSEKGKFTVFKFQCAPGTVYDPETEVCNYPDSTKRLECDGISNDLNEIDEVQHGFLSLMTNKLTKFPEQTTTQIYSDTIYKITDTTNLPTTFESKVFNMPTLPTSSSNTSDSLVSLTTKQPLPISTNQKSTISTSDSEILLYQKPKLKNNLCKSDGFMGDYENCHKFYRCVGNQNSGFTRYDFSCSDSTVWDDDIQGCNHPWAVKKSRCGKSSSNIDENILSTGMPQSTSTKNTSFGEHYENSKNQETGELTSNEILAQTETAHQSRVQNEEQTNLNKSNNSQQQKQTNNDLSESHVQSQVIAGNNVTQAQALIDFLSQPNFTTSDLTTAKTSRPTSFFNNRDYYSTPENLEHKNECTDSGFMGDSKECQKFYRCVDNGIGGYTRYEFYCGEGTLWDAKLEACNHAWAVTTCVSKQLSQESNIASSKNTSTSTESYKSSTQPNKNFVTLPEGIDHNHQNFSYDIPDQNFSTTSSTYTTLKNITNNDCRASGVIGDKVNCNVFYRCVEDGEGGYIKHKFQCAEGTVWDPLVEACNYAENVGDCSENVRITTMETSSKPTTTLANSSFKPASIVTTPSQLISGSTNNEFESSYNVNDDKITSLTNRTVESAEISYKCKSLGFVGDKQNCKKFYRCVDNGNNTFTRHEFFCGDGAAWDSTINSCNHEWAVDRCSHTYATTAIQEESIHYNTTKQEDKKSSNICTKNGVYGDKNNCQKFYRCEDKGNGGFIRYEFYCGQGSTWNEIEKTCKQASTDNDCAITYEPTSVAIKSSTQSTAMMTTTTSTIYYDFTKENPTYATPTKFDEYVTSHTNCEAEGFFADTSNCKRFYRCVNNGKGDYNKHEFVCSEGTIWNQEITACDYETSNIKCVSDFTEYTNYTTEHQETVVGVVSPTDTIRQEEHNTHQNASFHCSSEGFHSDPSDCTRFYRCVVNNESGFTKYNFSCADGTIWIQEIQSCGHDNEMRNCSYQNNSTHKMPEDSYQTSTSITTTSVTLVSELLIPSYNQENNTREESTISFCSSEGYYSDENDCKLFYRCVDNGNGGLTKYDFTCGEGTAWDKDINGCNHMSLVATCQASSSQSEITTDDVVDTSTITTTIILESNTTDSSDNYNSDCDDDYCSEEGYFGNLYDCKKFYRCVDDGQDGFIRYDFTCGDGTIWDQDIDACNHPQDVSSPSCELNINCSTSTVSATTQSSTSTTQYEQELSNTSQVATSEQPDNYNFTCTEAGFFSSPNDCKKFYRCVDWDGDGSKFSIFHFECGEGTIWDPNLETCNYEESVNPARDCSGTDSQTENSVDDISTTEKTITQETPQTSLQTTTQLTTTRKPTTFQDTTTEKTEATSEKPTTQKPLTTQKSTTTQQTTKMQSPATEQQQTTTQQPSTTEEPKTTRQTTTTQKPTTTRQTTTTPQTMTTQQTTTTQQTMTTEQPMTTLQSTTTAKTTTQKSTTNLQTTISHQPTMTTSETITTEKSTETSSVENTTAQKSTTEQNTQKTTNNLPTNTEYTPVTEQINTTESSTTDGIILTSTQLTTDTTTGTVDQETTSESSSATTQKCPETDDDQYLFVCPTSFRRHPKYCNLFYQCTEEDDSHDAKIAVFTCPNNTIYEESKIQCVEEEKAENSCDGEIASRRRVKHLGFRYKESIVVTTDSHRCTAVGSMPFEKNSDCSPGFLKCQDSKSGKLRGYVYQCPENYIYWSISRKCERKENLRDCKLTTNNWRGRWEIPIEKHNVSW